MSEVLQLVPLPVPTSYAPPAGLPITRAFDATQLDAVDGDEVRAIVTHSMHGMPAALWERFPNLELIANLGVGLDKLDLAEARRRDVRVTYTPDHLTADVADLALTVTMSLLRRIPAADAYLRAGRWSQAPFPPATSARGRRIGIVGFGRIGRAIAERAVAFGMTPGYHSRRADPGSPLPWFDTAVGLAGWADVLVAAVPGGAATEKMVSADVLGALGSGGIFVNIARASVVDEDALVAAMRDGVIAGVATELFDPASPLRERLAGFDNVLMTPHIGSSTVQTRMAMADAVYGNVQALLDGRPLTDLATP